MILHEVKDINLEINFNNLFSDHEIELPKIYYPKIIEVDSEIQTTRVHDFNHDIFNCKYSNRLPHISWNHFNLNNENINELVDKRFTKDDENNLLYGVEVFNAENDKEVF